jgi:hypothetical protein
LDQTNPNWIYLSGIYMDLSQDKRFENDMTKSGVFCPKDNNELEKVSSSDMHVCHWCGGQWRVDEKGEITEVQFEGFE